MSEETSLEYNKFTATIKNIGWSRWLEEVENSNCKIIVSLPFEINNINPFDISTDKDEEYSKWCQKNCDDKYYIYNENYVFFKTEEDAMAFKLRWL